MNRIIATIILAALIFPTAAHARSWDKARLRKEVRAAAKHYKLTKAETRWLERAAVDIVFRLPGKPRCESSGAWHAHSGSHRGIFQYNNRWRLPKALKKRAKNHKHPHGWRCCPTCSTWRFVRSFHDGGKPAIRRHWKATLGK